MLQGFFKYFLLIINLFKKPLQRINFSNYLMRNFFGYFYVKKALQYFLFFKFMFFFNWCL